ncbi:hypothetical protein Tco_0836078 [Tanacetum coccineum]
MDNLNITMAEYIRLEEEKARKRGKVFNWETAKYGKIWYDEDVLDLRSVENEFPAIVFNDSLTSNETLSCEPTAIYTLVRRSLRWSGDLYIGQAIYTLVEVSIRWFQCIYNVMSRRSIPGQERSNTLSERSYTMVNFQKKAVYTTLLSMVCVKYSTNQVKTQKIQAGVQVSRQEVTNVIFSIGSTLKVLIVL